MAVLPLRQGAVATSGTAARGRHITDPRTGEPVVEHLLSATVTGPSLTWADVLATATFVEGPAALSRVADLPGYDALLALPDGRTLATPPVSGGQCVLKTTGTARLTGRATAGTATTVARPLDRSPRWTRAAVRSAWTRTPTATTSMRRPIVTSVEQ